MLVVIGVSLFQDLLGTEPENIFIYTHVHTLIYLYIHKFTLISVVSVQ